MAKCVPEFANAELEGSISCYECFLDCQLLLCAGGDGGSEYSSALFRQYGAVLRVPQAVTHFSPGSNRWMPTQETPLPNVFMSGDWVKNVPHGANGLSQERALVTGYRAANMVIHELAMGEPKEILQVEEDEEHVKVARNITKQITSALPFPVSFINSA